VRRAVALELRARKRGHRRLTLPRLLRGGGAQVRQSGSSFQQRTQDFQASRIGISAFESVHAQLVLAGRWIEGSGVHGKAANPSAMHSTRGSSTGMTEAMRAGWLRCCGWGSCHRVHLPGSATTATGLVAPAEPSGQTGHRSTVARGQYPVPESEEE
jgi:hypothetical protein